MDTFAGGKRNWWCMNSMFIYGEAMVVIFRVKMDTEWKTFTSPMVFNDCWPVEMLQAKQSKGTSSLQYYFVPVRRDKSWHLDRTNRFCCKQNTWAFYYSPSLMSLATVSLTKNTWFSFVAWKIWKYVQLLQTSVSIVSSLKGPRHFWTCWSISEN